MTGQLLELQRSSQSAAAAALFSDLLEIRLQVRPGLDSSPALYYVSIMSLLCF